MPPQTERKQFGWWIKSALIDSRIKTIEISIEGSLKVKDGGTTLYIHLTGKTWAFFGMIFFKILFYNYTTTYIVIDEINKIK